jgi:L-rhamnose mutarotase
VEVGRAAFMFKIKPELKAEYKKAHDEIWPEFAKEISDSGISNYSIYFRKDGTLFAFMEVDDFNKSMGELGKTELNAKWQIFMDRFFVKEDPSKLGPDIEMLEEVFHLD